MAMWYETSVTYDKMMENGSVKKVTEKYLVDSLSFAEAEARTTEERKPFTPSDFDVRAAKRTKITQIFGDNEAERFYLAKVAFITIDEKTAAEKRTVSQILVGAKDFDDALQIFKDGMKDTMADWELVSLSETQIMQVYPAKLG